MIPPASNTADHPANHAGLVNVAENLYRVQLPTDRPGKPTGKYYALIKRAGKQFRRSLKTKDRKLADRRLAELRGQVGNLTLSPDSNLSFEEVAKRWMAITAHTLKPRSENRRQSAIQAVLPYFRGMTIRNIGKVQCERWLMERGATIAPQTFAHELSAMKNVFNHALDRGLILSNPAGHIKRRRILQAKINVPTQEQFQALVAAIRRSDGRADSQLKATAGADLVELLAYSGVRVGEAVALRFGDCSFKRKIITVTGGEGGTKNSEVRSIPMADALRKLLIRLHKARQPAASDLVSPIKSAKTAINKACIRLNLPHFHHHDFRHFFATTCIESGVDIPTISRWLGHKDGGALAMRVYGHLRQEHSSAQIKRVKFKEPLQKRAPSNLIKPNFEAAAG